MKHHPLFFIVSDCVPAVGEEESNFNLRDTDCDNEDVNTIWHSLSFMFAISKATQMPQEHKRNEHDFIGENNKDLAWRAVSWSPLT